MDMGDKDADEERHGKWGDRWDDRDIGGRKTKMNVGERGRD